MFLSPRTAIILSLLRGGLLDNSDTNPTFTPLVIEDESGYADQTNNITWKPIPSFAVYKTSTVYDDGGLATLHMMCSVYLRVVQPNELPYGESEFFTNHFSSAGHFVPGQLSNHHDWCHAPILY